MPTGTPSATGPSSRPGYAAYPSSVMIDLGTDREPDADADPPLRIGRPVKAALLVLLSLFALTGAAAARPGLTEVASLGDTPAAAFALSTDAAFIAAYGDEVNTSIVRRYGLHRADGTPDWTTGLPQTVDNVTVAEKAGVVLASSYSGQGVTALDANTGHVLWKEPVTYLVDLVDDTVLLTVQNDDGPSTLRLARLRSGSTVWMRTTRDNTAYWQLDVGPGTTAAGHPDRGGPDGRSRHHPEPRRRSRARRRGPRLPAAHAGAELRAGLHRGHRRRRGALCRTARRWPGQPHLLRSSTR